MKIEAIPLGKNPPEEVNVIVEVPVGGEPIKYELDKDSGAIFVDRFLHTPMRYPGNYGFIPHTLSDDGDPIDVVICNSRPLMPGCVIPCRPIGVLKMEDESGQDEKLIAVPSKKMTAMYDHVEDYDDIQPALLKQIEHFFERYKDLEPNKWVKVSGWGNKAEAHKMIEEAIARAQK